MAQPLLLDSTWRDQQKYESAEAFYQCKIAGTTDNNTQNSGASKLKNEIAEARQQIQKALSSSGGVMASGGDQRINTLEKENKDLKKIVEDLKKMVSGLEGRVTALEKGSSTTKAPTATPAPAADDGDDDFDLFGDDDEEAQEAADKLREQRIKEYAEKKAKKPALIPKSSIVLDVKPWDDETDMKELERNVRTIVKDGLVWGQSKLVPVGYGIKKLQIMCVVEDDKIGTDDLEDAITEFEDYVQSVDISAFNKI